MGQASVKVPYKSWDRNPCGQMEITVDGRAFRGNLYGNRGAFTSVYGDDEYFGEESVQNEYEYYGLVGPSEEWDEEEEESSDERDEEEEDSDESSEK